MSDIIINLVSDYENETSSAAGMGAPLNSHLHPLAHDRLR